MRFACLVCSLCHLGSDIGVLRCTGVLILLLIGDMARKCKGEVWRASGWENCSYLLIPKSVAGKRVGPWRLQVSKPAFRWARHACLFALVSIAKRSECAASQITFSWNGSVSMGRGFSYRCTSHILGTGWGISCGTKVVTSSKDGDILKMRSFGWRGEQNAVSKVNGFPQSAEWSRTLFLRQWILVLWTYCSSPSAWCFFFFLLN